MADRSGGLWIVTLLILGMFVAVAAITPSAIPDLGGPGGDGTVREGADYRQPVLRSSVGEMVEDEELSLRLTSEPARSFLAEGGNWVWTFSLEGGLGANEATIRYGGDKYVGWMSGSSAITGFGPRFSQGPSSPMAGMRAITDSGITARSSSRRIIIPGLAHASKSSIERVTRWNVEVGPVSGFELPLYLLKEQ